MTTDILIRNPECAVAEPEMLHAVIQRAVQWDTANGVTITASPRQPNGWLEWGLFIIYGISGKIFIGCLQRRPGEPIEFHS